MAPALAADLDLEEAPTTRPGPARPASTQPATSPASTQSSRVPVFSRGRGAGSAIAPHELQELIARAQKQAPAGHSLWFLDLDFMRQPAVQREYSAVAHFTADETTKRFRRGRSTTLWSPGLELQIAEEHQRMVDEGGPVEVAKGPQYQGWCQVAPPDRPFTDEFDLLHPELMPFKLPLKVSAEEIVRLVDFARTSPSTIEDPSTEPWANLEFDGKQPILDIRREPDGVYEVRTLRPTKAEPAGGQMLRCKVKGEKLKVVDILTWVP
ncbi:MAG: hypothetical protein NTW19_19040 [Planctomycetota bacterium]|nr:hypothetical protein [Planctomycetota bacterium]